MSDIPAHEIVVSIGGEDKAFREACYDIRIKVFYHEQGFPLETEIDE